MPAVIEPTQNAGASERAPDAASESVRELIKAIADGNTSAFAVFYEQWFDRALELSKSLTRRDESFCLDVVQDAMMRAIRSLRPSLGISTRHALDCWMTRVVHTTAIDCLRRESRRRRRDARARADEKQVSPDSRSELDERIDWIRRCLDDLSASERELVISRFGTDRTIHASAADAGVSPGAAAGRLTRLMKRLQSAAKELFHDDAP